MHKEFKVGLIGCGVIGERRLDVAVKLGLGKPCVVYDTNAERALKVADKFGVPIAKNAESVTDGEAEVVIVATPNHVLAEYGARALANGKHALIEKPGATEPEQIETLLAAQGKTGAVCKMGYNHRFHPAAQRLMQELATGKHGRLLWIRGAYGHGGRPGYEKEWRFDRKLSGGGEIIDQGVHLLDLVQGCSREAFALQYASRQNAFYTSTEEDNGFLVLQSPSGAVAQLHCSVTQWKNLFRFEVATENSLLNWDGLGNANYGAETLTICRRKPAGGAPDREVLEYGNCGMESWEAEWKHFVEACQRGNRDVASSARDSQWIFRVVAGIRAQSDVVQMTGHRG